MFARVKAPKAKALIASGKVDVIDVRDPAEWARGHIDGARLVSLASLRAAPEAHLAHLEKDAILFVCAAGVRSETAARIALELGFARVYSLVGGTQSWVKAGLPLVNQIRVAV